MRVSVMIFCAALIAMVTGADAGRGALACVALCVTSKPPATGARCSVISADREIGAKHVFGCSVPEVRLEPDANFIRTVRSDLKDPGPPRNRVGEPAKSDLERVIARYSETIMVHPEDDDAYFRRGIANLYTGALSKALADITKASELDPQSASAPAPANRLHLAARFPSRRARSRSNPRLSSSALTSGSFILKDDESIIKAGCEAWQRTGRNAAFNDWIKIAEALAVGRAACMRLGGCNSPFGSRYNALMRQWLQERGLQEIAGQERHKALAVLDELPAILEWRETLTDEQRRRLNHPSAILGHFKRHQRGNVVKNRNAIGWHREAL